MVAISLAVLEFVYRSATPNVYQEGRLPETTIYKSNIFRSLILLDILQYPRSIIVPGLVIVRMDARMAFYNVNHFRSSLGKFLAGSPDKVHSVIIDAGGIAYIDPTSMHNLEEIVDDFQKKGESSITDQAVFFVKPKLCFGFTKNTA